MVREGGLPGWVDHQGGVRTEGGSIIRVGGSSGRGE